jgi:hypothetical protein
MFQRQYCAIFTELTVPDQICYTNVMDATTRDSERKPTLTIPGFSIMTLVKQIWSGTVSSLKMVQYWHQNM